MPAALGRVVLARLGWDRGLTTGEVLAFSGVAGASLSSAFWLCLAAGNWLVAPAVWGWWALCGAVTVVQLRTRPRGFPPLTLRSGAVVGTLGLVACVWLWPLFLQTLLPNSDWDSAVYHLPLALRYGAGELWNFDPLFSAYSFPGAASLSYAAFGAVGLEGAVIPFNFLLALATVAATAALAAQFGGRRAAIWAGGILASTPLLWQLGVDPRVDGILACWVALAFYALARWWRTERAPHWLCLMALALSLALGTKYTGLFFAGGLAMLVLARSGWLKRRGVRAASARWLLAASLALALPHGVWYAANSILHGDPVFDLARGGYYVDGDGRRAQLAVALEPHLERWREERPFLIDKEAEDLRRRRGDAPGRAGRNLRTALRSNLFNVFDVVLNPEHYAVKPNHSVSPLLLLFPLWPLLTRRRRAEAWTFSALGVALYIPLASQLSVIRYALPLIPLFAAGAGTALARFDSRVWRGLLAVVVAGLLVHQFGANRVRLADLEPASYLSGDLSRSEWLARVGYNGVTAMPRAVAFVNAAIDDGAMKESDRILMAGEAKGHLLRCGVLPDSTWNFQRWLVALLNADLDHAEVARQLGERGVTHVLYNKQFFIWVIERTHTPRTRISFATIHLKEFLEHHAELVYERDGIQLHRLTQPNSQAPTPR